MGPRGLDDVEVARTCSSTHASYPLTGSDVLGSCTISSTSASHPPELGFDVMGLRASSLRSTVASVSHSGGVDAASSHAASTHKVNFVSRPLSSDSDSTEGSACALQADQASDDRTGLPERKSHRARKRKQLGGSVAPQHLLFFLELFAGAAGLTRAVRVLGLPVHDPVDTHTAPGGFDLLNPRDYRTIMGLVRSGRVKWLHGGPPCKTFSRARRRDHHAHVRVLRSDKYPAGLPGVQSAKLQEGNELARRMAKLAKAQQRVGGLWSIENPLHSFMWQFAPVAKLKRLPGVRLIPGGPMLLRRALSEVHRLAHECAFP